MKKARSVGEIMSGMPKVVHTVPSIVEIYSCAEAGAPMERETEVILKAGVGIIGDRYGERKGAFSNAQPPKIRNVTFISLAQIVQAAAELAKAGNAPFLARETRRNFLTWNVDLNALVGKEFSFGEVRFRGIELADPCHRPSALAKKTGFKEFFHGIGGLRAEVLNDGILKIGDRFAL